MSGTEMEGVQQSSVDKGRARVGVFTLLLLFLSLQADGFRLSHDQNHQQALLVPFTLIFFGLLLWMLSPHVSEMRRLDSLCAKIAGRSGSFIAILGFLGLSAALFVYSSHYFAAFGYRLHPLAVAGVFGCSFIALGAGLWKTGRFVSDYFIFVVILAYIAIYLLSIWSFPNNVGRSDMLPLLSEAGKVLLGGHDPYRFYVFPIEKVFLTYLPGTLLAFIPAVWLHIDLRFINILYVVILGILIYRAAADRYRLEVAGLLGLFLLSPYVLYRHEIYTQPHWLSIVACLLLMQRRRFIWAAAIFGVSAALSQFSWILFPFLLLFIFRQRGYRGAVIWGAIALLVATAILGPFIGWSPHDFFYGVLSHWQNMPVNARPVNFSYWIASFVGARHLQWVQFVVLAAFFLYCVVAQSCRTLTQCLRWMAISLTAFVMLNILVWGYFFLLLEVILILYVMSANGWFKVPDQADLNLEAGKAGSVPDHPSAAM
jgi:uncharacterized membrane protein